MSRRSHTQISTIVYEDEGHGFTKRENELGALKDVAEFMEGYLARQ